MAEKIQIFGERLSPFVERLYLQVKYKGLEDKVEFPGLPEGGLKSEEYLGINPLGKMPALKWGDFTLFESGVIAFFLEIEFPEKPLLPKGSKDVAIAALPLRIMDVYFYPHLGPLLQQLISDERDEELIARKLAEMKDCLKLIESRMTGETRIFDNIMTMTDISLFCGFFLGVKYFPVFGMEFLDETPKLEKWYEGLSKEPMFRESIEVREKQLTEFVANLMQKKNKS